MGQIGFPVKQVTPKDIIGCEICYPLFLLIRASTLAQPVKSNLNEKLDERKRLFRPSILMPEGSEKLKMKILSCGKKELPANQCQPICQPWADWQALASW